MTGTVLSSLYILFHWILKTLPWGWNCFYHSQFTGLWNIPSAYIPTPEVVFKDPALGSNALLRSSGGINTKRREGLYVNFRFWLADVDMYSSCRHPGQALWVSPSLIVFAAYWAGRACLFLAWLPALRAGDGQFPLSLGSSQGFRPTDGILFFCVLERLAKWLAYSRSALNCILNWIQYNRFSCPFDSAPNRD